MSYIQSNDLGQGHMQGLFAEPVHVHVRNTFEYIPEQVQFKIRVLDRKLANTLLSKLISRS